MKQMMNTVVIPAYEPTEKLIEYVNELRVNHITSIVVVDDGSSEEKRYIFKKIQSMKGCTLLTHLKNAGKGAALKTAIRYIRDTTPKTDGIITADSDGQHSVEDVLRMDMALKENPDNLILGVREFGEGTPTRSMLGNTISAKTLKALYGIDLNDTQTGLRAISRDYFDWLLTLRGQRYEYELNMIIHSKNIALPIHTIPIQTLYFNNNEASHFRAVRDGAKVYGQMLLGLAQYLGNSCISAATDVILFTVLFYATQSLLTATMATAIASTIARVVSSVVDFRLNRSTFASKETASNGAWVRYYMLWTVQLFTSIALLMLADSVLGVMQTLAKPFVDLLLGIASYQIQLHWVFKPKHQKISLKPVVVNG